MSSEGPPSPNDPMSWLQWSLSPAERAKADDILQRDLERRQKERERKERAGQLDEIRERCATLPGFIKEGWSILEPAMTLEWGWALDAMADHLTAVSNEEILRLLMNVPPGFMKSLMVTGFWPAWEWGVLGRPSLRYLNASHGKDLAERNIGKMKDLVQSDWYRDLWPDVLVIGKGAADEWHNESTGWAQATAAASLTGNRGDRLTVDDPHNPEGTDSPTIRNKTIRRMRETAPTRINDPKRSAIIVTMQRLHEQDVSGMILSEKLGYTHLEIPMRFEPKRRCISYNRHGEKVFRDPRSYEGQLAFPERFDLESQNQTEKEMTAYAVAGQMQQSPTPRDGGLFKRDWFEVVDAYPMGGVSVRAWDLAGSKPKAQASSDPDWTVGLKGVRASDGNFYVIDMVRKRDTPGKVAAAIKNTATQDGFGTTISLAQDPGQAGKFQVEFLVSLLAAYTVKSETVSGDKQLRAGGAATQAEFGKIKILRAPWNGEFFEEVTTFPGAKHDDIVDALSDLIRVLSSLTVYDLSGVS